MPSNPDISVIIPVYNPGPHFDECIESVLSQAGCSLEAIFVDDGSTDDSPAILDELAQGDSRIRVFHQENQGAGPARNLGIEHAAGEYIAFMDSDDYYPTDHALSDLLTAARDKDATICGGSMALLNQETGTFIDAFADDELYVFDHEGWRNYADDQMDYGYQRYIFRKDLFEDTALRFPARRWYEDPLFFVPAMYKAQRYYVLSDATYIYRIAHKQTNWTPRLACDLLKGSMENYRFAHEHGFIKLEDTIMHRLATVDCPHVVFNITDEEVIKCLGDFQAMLNDLDKDEVVPILRELGKRSEYLDVEVQELVDERANTVKLKQELAQAHAAYDKLKNRHEVALVRLARRVSMSGFYRRLQSVAHFFLKHQ